MTALSFLRSVERLTAGEAEELGRLFKSLQAEKDTVLFDEAGGAPAFYVIEEGRVELTRRDAGGRARIVDILVQGDFFGESALLDMAGLPATARVVEDGRFLLLGRDDFLELTTRRPALAVKVLGFVARKLEQPERLSAFRFDPSRFIANRVIAVAGPASAAGRTFVATNLAAALAEQSQDDGDPRVGLLDLHTPFGNADLHMAVELGRDWGGYIEAVDDDCENASIEDFCVPVTSSLFLAGAPSDPRFAAGFEPASVGLLVEAMLKVFDRVVIDLPPGLDPIVERAIELADRTIVVTPYTIDALARLKTFCRALTARPGFPHRFPVVVNRYGSSCDATMPEREALPVPLLARLPNNGRVPAALRSGYFWFSRHDRSALTKCFREMAARLTGSDDVLDHRSSFLSSWFPFLERKEGTVSLLPWERCLTLPVDEFFRIRRGRSRLALAEALYLDGRHFRAFQELKRAVEDAPGLSRAYTLLGKIAIALGREREAMAYYESALQLNAEDTEALAGYASLDGGERACEAALHRLEKAVELHPGWADLRCRTGLVLRAMGRLSEAEDSYEAALAINPAYSDALRGMAELCVARKKYGKALEYYVACLSERTGDLSARYGLSRLFRSLGLVGPALDTLEELVRICPHHHRAYDEIPGLRRSVEALDEEIRNLERAVGLHPTFPDVLFRLGDACFRRGAFDRAVSVLRKALRYDPDMVAAKECLLRVKATKMRLSSSGGGSQGAP